MEIKEVKEYLAQMQYLDERINSKLDQLAVLKELATKANATITGMPKSSSTSHSRMEDTICKMIDLNDSLALDIDKLVDLKKEIKELIDRIPNCEEQTILEKRYLCYKQWNDIADEMHYTSQYALRIHSRALYSVKKILENR